MPGPQRRPVTTTAPAPEAVSTMLVVDTTNRGLEMFTANVSRAETGLVVRPALPLPGLGFFARGADWRRPKDSAGLPVLLIGDGYEARSSAGFVAVSGHEHLPKVPIIGWLGDHGLRVIRPRVARLLGPVRFIADLSAMNSNARTAEAVLAGIQLLRAADRRAVVIAEGQSDYALVHRLLPADAKATDLAFTGEVAEEFRREMFAPEAVMRSLFRAAYRAEHRAWPHGTAVNAARWSLRQSAERLPSVSGLQRGRLHGPETDYHAGRGLLRLTTWEAAALAGCEGVWQDTRGGGCPHLPLTRAQLRALAQLDPDSAEFTALAKADARELSLPIEEWERPLLDGKSPSEPVATATDEEVRLAALPEWERGIYS